VKILKVGIPKGSLENATIELFKKSGWKISMSSRSYFPSVDDDEIRCTLVRAQEMSRFVETGTLDVGLTGKDWILENGSDVVVIRDLIYSKTSTSPARWVLVGRGLAYPSIERFRREKDLYGAC
jgi:ATP phosphoribosyltransferase